MAGCFRNIFHRKKKDSYYLVGPNTASEGKYHTKQTLYSWSSQNGDPDTDTVIAEIKAQVDDADDGKDKVVEIIRVEEEVEEVVKSRGKKKGDKEGDESGGEALKGDDKDSEVGGECTKQKEEVDEESSKQKEEVHGESSKQKVDVDGESSKQKEEVVEEYAIGEAQKDKDQTGHDDDGRDEVTAPTESNEETSTLQHEFNAEGGGSACDDRDSVEVQISTDNEVTNTSNVIEVEEVEEVKHTADDTGKRKVAFIESGDDKDGSSHSKQREEIVEEYAVGEMQGKCSNRDISHEEDAAEISIATVSLQQEKSSIDPREPASKEEEEGASDSDQEEGETMITETVEEFREPAPGGGITVIRVTTTEVTTTKPSTTKPEDGEEPGPSVVTVVRETSTTSEVVMPAGDQPEEGSTRITVNMDEDYASMELDDLEESEGGGGHSVVHINTPVPVYSS